MWKRTAFIPSFAFLPGVGASAERLTSVSHEFPFRDFPAHK